MANKQELVDYLNKHVFEPILHASDSKYNEHQKKELEDVKRRTEAEQERFRKYESAQKVVEMYKDDLHSEKARPVNKRLKDLGLPILADVKDEFLKLAGE